MAAALTTFDAIYSDPALAHWPRPLRLMAHTAKAGWRQNRPDAIALLVALNDLRHSPRFRGAKLD